MTVARAIAKKAISFMVNFLEFLYAITGLALLTMMYYAVRGRTTDTARERFNGAFCVFVFGIVACVSLYMYLS
jgi:heme/copper-type cytochrome/quinol oxidase subunit 2